MINTIIDILKSFLLTSNKEFSSESQLELISPLEEKVDIIYDKRIRSKYKKGWIHKIRKNPITEIVLHGTGGGDTIEGLLSWVYNGQRSASYYKGIALFHYLIGKDGTIVEVIDPEYYVYHSSSSKHDKQTIGIEMINSSKTNRRPYTDKQYESLFSLINHLQTLYPSIDRITSHKYNIIMYNPKWVVEKKLKECPGPGFSWKTLDKELVEKGFTFQTDGNLRYDIKKS